MILNEPVQSQSIIIINRKMLMTLVYRGLLYPEMETHLQNKWADPNEYLGPEPVSFSVLRSGHPELILLMVKYGLNVFNRDEYGNTILHLACELKFQDLAVELVRGCPKLLEVPGYMKRLPIHVAAMNIDLRDPCWKMADVRIQDENGDTPLHLACEYSFENIVHILRISSRGLIISNYFGQYPPQILADSKRISANDKLRLLATIRKVCLKSEVFAIITYGVNVHQLEKELKTPLSSCTLQNVFGEKKFGEGGENPRASCSGSTR